MLSPHCAFFFGFSLASVTIGELQSF